MNTSAETQPSDTTISTYEMLRRQSIEHATRASGELGLSVFLRHGMLAWTRTCSPPPNATVTPPVPLDTALVSLSLRDDIIGVMASMVTSVSRSAHNGALHT